MGRPRKRSRGEGNGDQENGLSDDFGALGGGAQHEEVL